MTDQDRRTAIAAVLAQQEAAWRAGDAAGFSAMVLPDVVFTNVVGMFAVGRAPFEAQHARIFSSLYKGSTLRQEIASLVFIRDDVAIIDTLTELSGFASLPPGAKAIDGVLRTRLEQVMVLEDGAWRVASFHNVAVDPSVPSAPPP